jgi:hypothetical protein
MFRSRLSKLTSILPVLPQPKRIPQQNPSPPSKIKSAQDDADADLNFPAPLRTFRKYIGAYSSLRPQALAANATANFTHRVLPLDLGIPTRNLDEFKTHAAMIFSLFGDFAMIPVDADGLPNVAAGADASGAAMRYYHVPGAHFDPTTNTVIAWCKMGGRVNGQSEKGAKLVEQGVDEWWTECVIFVRMDAEGRKIEGVREFVHAGKAMELRRRLEGVLNS